VAIEVGSVQVAVVPSAEGFVPKLRAQLTGVSAIGDEIGRQIADPIASKLGDSIRRGIEEGGAKGRAAAASQGASSGGAFADSFKAKVEAALKSLPPVQIGAATNEAEQKIRDLRAELATLAGQQIGVDISDAEALAKLDELKRRLFEVANNSPSARVQVDSLAAMAKLEEFQAEMRRIDGETARANVEVNSNGSDKALSGISGMMAAIIGLGPPLIPVAAAGVAAIAGIGGAAAASAIGVGVLALAISGVAKASQLLGQEQQAQAQDAARAAASATARAAAEDAAAKQLEGAQASLAQARSTAANAAISSAEAVKNAEQSLADAERAQAEQRVTSAETIARAEENLATVVTQVAQARAQAARTVENAEQSLTSANRRAADAQKALNDAREQAVRDLEDSANRQADAQLSAQQAALDLQSTQLSSVQVLASSTSTDLQKQQATLSLAEAQQRLAEAQLEAQRATEDNTKAQAAGIDGDKGVVSAQQALLTAVQQQTAAQQALADATAAQQQQAITGARQVADAQRSLADAQRTAANQAVTSAQQVTKAQQGVSDALRAQAQQASTSAASIASAQRSVASAMDAVSKAASTSSTSGVSALAAIRAQLALLGPDTIAFAQMWREQVSPMFRSLQDSAAGGLLPGVTQFFSDLKPLMPGLSKFIGDVASAIGDLFAQAGKALQSPFWAQFFAFLDRVTGPTIKTIGETLGNIAAGFAGLGEAFFPVAQSIGDGVFNLSKRFADWAAGLQTNKGFQTFLGYLRDNMPKVAKLFGDLLTLAEKLVTALAPWGSVLLGVISSVVGWLAKMSPGTLLAITEGIVALFLAFKVGLIAVKIATLEQTGAMAALNVVMDANPIGLVILAVAALAAGFVYLWTHSETLRDIVKGTWTVIKDVIEVYWRDYIQPVFHFIIKAWDDIIGAFQKAWDWVSGFFKAHWALVLVILTGPIGIAVDEIVTHWKGITGAFSAAWHWVSSVFAKLWDGVKDVLTGPINVAKSAFDTVWSGIKSGARTFITDIRKVWDGLKEIFAAPIRFVVETVLNNGLIKAWNWVADHIGLKNLRIGTIDVPGLAASAGNSTGGGTNYAGATAYATGGVLPGYAPGRDSVMAMLSPGEGVLRPEVVRALGADTIHAWNRAAVSGGMPHFAGGGILGAIGGLAGDVWGGIKDVGSAAWGAAKDVASLVADPVKWLTSHLTAPLNALKAIESNGFGQLAGGVPRHIASELVDKLKSLVGLSGGASTAPVSVAGAQQYQPAVLNVLSQLGLPSGDTTGVLSMIAHESAGIADAVNRTDSNWIAGHPSVGLMQVIQGTFDQYAGPYRNTGPFLYGVSTDPLANIYAGVNYALHTYGESMIAAGGRHDASGQYIGYDNGGYLQPGHTLVYNGTGAPEPVFTGQQWQDIRSGGGSAVLADEDRALLRSVVALADRPVSVQVGEREIATTVRDYWNDRAGHGDKAWTR
jgi:phage-related protein